MSAEPWKKWTPEFLHEAAIDARQMGFPPWAEMIEAFAALLEAEQRGERCVLPLNVCVLWQQACGDWCVELSNDVATLEGDGATKEAAILDLARKLRGDK